MKEEEEESYTLEEDWQEISSSQVASNSTTPRQTEFRDNVESTNIETDIRRWVHSSTVGVQQKNFPLESQSSNNEAPVEDIHHSEEWEVTPNTQYQKPVEDATSTSEESIKTICPEEKVVNKSLNGEVNETELGEEEEILSDKDPPSHHEPLPLPQPNLSDYVQSVSQLESVSEIKPKIYVTNPLEMIPSITFMTLFGLVLHSLWNSPEKQTIF